MYWPMAIVNDIFSGKPDLVYTDKGCFTIEDAKKQIELWKKMQETTVFFAYIKDDTGLIVYYENNLSLPGKVNYDAGYKYDYPGEISDSKGKRGL